MKGVRQTITVAAFAAVVGASASCGDVVRGDRSGIFLIIDSLGGSSGGGSSSAATNPVKSDVVTNNTIFNDPGSAVLRVAMKDVTTLTQPTTNNQVTIHRVHVSYRR